MRFYSVIKQFIYKVDFLTKPDNRVSTTVDKKILKMKSNIQYTIVLLCLVFCIVPFVITHQDVTLLPYPGDCSKYQQCDESGCFVMSCGKGTEFNPAINTCDYPLQDRQGCENRMRTTHGNTAYDC